MYTLIDVAATIRCYGCNKISNKIKDECKSCHDIKYDLPEGWGHWPSSHSSISYPTPYCCPGCKDNDDYKKAEEIIKKENYRECCSDCGITKDKSYFERTFGDMLNAKSK